MNLLVGAVAGLGEIALTKEGLATAADQMRELMVADSQKFAGVTDGKTVLNNASGTSEGVNGDAFKVGGTRVDLDLLCGPSNERCAVQRNQDGTPLLDANGKTQLLIDDTGKVRFTAKDSNNNPISIDDFLKTPEGQKMSGATGGVQGYKGTLFGVPYEAGSWQDKLIEAFAGTHDFVGGKLSGLYDEQGNATRGRSATTRNVQDTWSATGAIAISAPFAAAQGLPPEVWKAIAILLKAAR
jgi:filamentous hemagglutinin